MKVCKVSFHIYIDLLNFTNSQFAEFLMKSISSLKKEIRNSKYFNYFDPFIKIPEKKFIIYTRGRTGSTVLTELLNCHPEMFCDYEIFNLSNTNTSVKYPGLYMKSCAKRASLHHRSVYGCKVKIEQLRDDHKYTELDSLFLKLHEDGWKFIHLKRSNTLEHKISGIISTRTNIFHIKKTDQFEHKKFKMDCQLLLDILDYGEVLDEMENKQMDTVPSLKINYEEDLLDNFQHQNTANKVFNYLGVKEYPVSTKLKKIIPQNLQDIILNYDEMINMLKKTKFVQYLDINQDI